MVIAVSLISSLLSAVGVFLIVDSRSANRHDDIQASEIRQCDDKVKDRVDNARGWTRAEKTWSARALDKKLSSEERGLAQATATTYQESANAIRTRIILCGPYVKDGRLLIDERLVREARGEL